MATPNSVQIPAVVDCFANPEIDEEMNAVIEETINELEWGEWNSSGMVS